MKIGQSLYETGNTIVTQLIERLIHCGCVIRTPYRALLPAAFCLFACGLLGLSSTAQAQPTNVNLPNTTINSVSVTVQATNSITANNGYVVGGSATVTFIAGNSIVLGPGFQATGGSAAFTFQASVSGQQTVATPTFSPGAATYSAPPTVTISTATSGATIRYTMDGSTPSETAGTVYTGAITVNNSLTIKAIAYESGWTDSTVASATYTVTGPQPTISSISPGSGAPGNSVTISGYGFGTSGTVTFGGVAATTSNWGYVPPCTGQGCSGNPPATIQATVPSGIVGTVNAVVTAGGVPSPAFGFTVNEAAPSAVPPMTVTPPSATMSGAAGVEQGLTFTVSSPNGVGDLADVQVLMNWGVWGTDSCYVMYYPNSNQMYLLADDGSTPKGPLTPGTSGTQSNTQCTLDAATSSFQVTGNNLSLMLGLTFSSSFLGIQQAYVLADSLGGMSSGSFYAGNVGAWTVTGYSSQLPTGLLTSAPTTQGTGGTFTFQMTDVNGAGFMPQAYFGFGSSPSALGCSIALYHDPGTSSANGAWLLADNGSWSGPVLPGSGTVESNSNCTITGAGASGSDSGNGSGNVWTYTISVIFNAAFSGTQNIYVDVLDHAGQSTGYQLEGQYTVRYLFNDTFEVVLPTSATVTPGDTATYKIAVQQPGYAGTIGLMSLGGTCPNGDTVSFTNASGTSNADHTMTLSVPVPSNITWLWDGCVSINGDTTIDLSAVVWGNEVDYQGNVTMTLVVHTDGSAVAIVSPTSITLPAGVVNSQYQGAAGVTITASGGDGNYNWAATGLPPNLTMNSGTGVISGMPISAGPWNNVVVTVTDGPYGEAHQQYTITINPGTTPLVTTPTFSEPGGSYSSTQTVTISTTTSGATIRYTTDNSTPTETNGTQCSGSGSCSVTIASTTTLKAIAYESGWADSAVASAVYTITTAVANPTFSEPGGSYSSTQTVAVSTTTSGATIGYTIDGSTATEANGTQCSSPCSVTIASTTTLKAIAYESGWADSAVASAVYTITVCVPTKEYIYLGGRLIAVANCGAQ